MRNRKLSKIQGFFPCSCSSKSFLNKLGNIPSETPVTHLLLPYSQLHSFTLHSTFINVFINTWLSHFPERSRWILIFSSYIKIEVIINHSAKVPKNIRKALMQQTEVFSKKWFSKKFRKFRKFKRRTFYFEEHLPTTGSKSLCDVYAYRYNNLKSCSWKV